MYSRTLANFGSSVVCFTLLGTRIALSQTSLSSNPHPSWPDLNPVTRLTAETFAHPPATDRPWVRVNTLPPTSPPTN